MEKKHRLVFLDVLRLISFMSVYVFHFLCALQAVNGGFTFSLTFSGFSLPAVAVAVFFMISGYGLMLSSRKSFSVREYYQKRCVRIFIPYLLVNVVYLAFLMIRYGQHSFFQYPVWKYVFWLFGVSEYLNSYGLGAPSLGIGEWFIGAIIFMYLLFPFLRYLLLRGRAAGVILLYLVVYLAWVFVYPLDHPTFTGFIAKTFSFFIGMALALDDEQKGRVIYIPLCLFVLTLSFLWNGITDLIDIEYLITADATAVFLLFREGNRILEKGKLLGKWCGIFTKTEYECFLVHHIVLNNVASVIMGRGWTKVNACFVLGISFLLTVGFAVLYARISGWLSSKLLKGIARRRQFVLENKE